MYWNQPVLDLAWLGVVVVLAMAAVASTALGGDRSEGTGPVDAE